MGRPAGAGGAGEPGNFALLVSIMAGAALGFVGLLVGRGIDRSRTRGDFITVYPPSEAPVAQ